MVRVVNRREQLLAALTEPRHKRDLVEELDLSRSTLDRAVRELETLGLIERDHRYVLTVTGRLVLERFDELLAEFDDIAAARQLLGALSRDAPMSVSMLRGAEVRRADQPTQPQVLDPVKELFDRAERIMGFSVAETNPEFSEGPQGELDTDGVDLAVVYDRTLVEHLRADGRLEPVMERERFDAHVHPDVPYGLGVVTTADGETVFLVVYDDDWTLRGLLVNDAPEACRWATDVFERYREAAEPLAE